MLNYEHSINSLVSVVIPTWNRRDSLVIAINSVLAQTYQNFEILVCDDGSTDDSESVVKTFNDERIKWIPGNHSGCPATPRNNGILASRGEFIAFLDSDDLWYPDKLLLQLKGLTLEKDPNIAITSNATVYNPKLHTESECLYSDSVEDNFFSLFSLFQDNKVVTSSVLITSTLQKKIGFFPEATRLKAYEDYAYWLRVATVGNFRYFPLTLIRYTDNPDFSVRSHTKNHSLKKKYVLIDYYLWVLSKFPLRFPIVLACSFFSLTTPFLIRLHGKLQAEIYMIKHRFFIILEIIFVSMLNMLGNLFTLKFHFNSRFFQFFRLLKRYIWKITH